MFRLAYLPVLQDACTIYLRSRKKKVQPGFLLTGPVVPMPGMVSPGRGKHGFRLPEPAYRVSPPLLPLRIPLCPAV